MFGSINYAGGSLCRVRRKYFLLTAAIFLSSGEMSQTKVCKGQTPEERQLYNISLSYATVSVIK